MYMRHAGARRGFAFMLSLGTLFLLSLTVIAMIIVLNYRVKQHEKGMDRIIAYYLCETAQTFAQCDFIIPGRFKTFPVTRSYTVNARNTAYTVSYTVEKKQGGAYEIVSSVPSPLGLGCTYKLRMGAKRGFPYFIRGKAGGG